MDRTLLAYIVDQYIHSKFDMMGANASVDHLFKLKDKIESGATLNAAELYSILNDMYPAVKHIVGELK